jgi:hypothetical protein
MCADGKDVLQRMVEVPLCAGVLVLTTARYPSPGALSFYSLKLAQHNESRESIASAKVRNFTDNRLRERVANFAERVATGIDALDFTGRQRLMRLLIERVRVTGWQVEIHLRVPLDEMPPPSPGNGGERPSPPGQTKSRPVTTGHPASVSSEDRLRSVSSKEALYLASSLGPMWSRVNQADSE